MVTNSQLDPIRPLIGCSTYRRRASHQSPFSSPSSTTSWSVSETSFQLPKSHRTISANEFLVSYSRARTTHPVDWSVLMSTARRRSGGGRHGSQWTRVSGWSCGAVFRREVV